MPSPAFEFFEIVAVELCAEPSRVMTRSELEIDAERAPLLEELMEETGTASTAQAVSAAVASLAAHFKDKGSALPFSYDPNTGRFDAIDKPYLCFIKQMRAFRSINTRSREFETEVMNKLLSRITGTLHRVGHPRDNLKTQAAFNKYLKGLGFRDKVLFDAEKDGGFDILWVLPLGSVSHRPIVSIQCKNGELDIKAGHESVGSGIQSLGCHGGLLAQVHVPCVLYNDYVCPEVLTPKAMSWVPLGLTDLSTLIAAPSATAI